MELKDVCEALTKGLESKSLGGGIHGVTNSKLKTNYEIDFSIMDVYPSILTNDEDNIKL